MADRPYRNLGASTAGDGSARGMSRIP
jgi:hypothetical protein